MNLRSHDPVAAANVAKVGAHEIERAAFARVDLLCGLAVLLDAAYANFCPAGGQHEFIAHRHATVEHGPCDDRAAARDGKGAIDRVAEVASFAFAALVV